MFNPLTERERTHRFGKSLINPVWYAKGALSAVQNQWRDIPEEWEQGASGLGKRYADIMGQYAIRKTVTFGFESMLHEDNRVLSLAQNRLLVSNGICSVERYSRT